MDLKEAGLIKGEILEHWYYRAKFAALQRITRDRPAGNVLDVGAGIGVFARALLAETGNVAATCVDPGYERDSDEMVAGKPLRFRREIGQSDASLVLMMDVLEHVPDDHELLAEYVAKMRPGTSFVITVPAFQWLWSEHDEFLEHYRRYTLAGMEALVERAGLRVQHGCYFYGLLLPLAALSRLLGSGRSRPGRAPRSQMRSFPPWLNTLFWLVCRAELPLLAINRLAGLSVLVVAQKP